MSEDKLKPHVPEPFEGFALVGEHGNGPSSERAPERALAKAMTAS